MISKGLIMLKSTNIADNEQGAGNGSGGGGVFHRFI